MTNLPTITQLIGMLLLALPFSFLALTAINNEEGIDKVKTLFGHYDVEQHAIDTHREWRDLKVELEKNEETIKTLEQELEKKQKEQENLKQQID